MTRSRAAQQCRHARPLLPAFAQMARSKPKAAKKAASRPAVTLATGRLAAGACTRRTSVRARQTDVLPSCRYLVSSNTFFALLHAVSTPMLHRYKEVSTRTGGPSYKLMQRSIMAGGVSQRDADAAIAEQVAIVKAKYTAAALERERVARSVGLTKEIVAAAKELEDMFNVLKEGGTGGYKPYYKGKTGEFRSPVSAVDLALQREATGTKSGLFHSWRRAFLSRSR
jgi:hypothetical protein